MYDLRRNSVLFFMWTSSLTAEAMDLVFTSKLIFTVFHPFTLKVKGQTACVGQTEKRAGNIPKRFFSDMIASYSQVKSFDD